MEDGELGSKLTIVIHSCEAFSDLWDANITLLDRNWKDRNCETILVTDAPTDKSYAGITVFCAGAGLELSDRIKAVIPCIQTEYVFMTLDDYFLSKEIRTSKICEIIRMMDCEKLDYVLLFKKHKPDMKFKRYKGIHTISLTRNYQICLYPGVWRKDFLLKTLRGTLNAWDYEVSLTGIAKEVGARCVQSRRNEFPILDGVRKGKLLIKASRYLKKHGLYSGNRQTMSFKAEFKLNMISRAKKILPRKIVARIRERKIRQGYSFYSDAFIKKFHPGNGNNTNSRSDMKPRVLIVGTVPYNEQSTSRAFHSYFCNWEKENLAQVFSHPKKPAKGHCATLYQITDQRLIRRRFDRNIKTGIVYNYCELPDRWDDASLEVRSPLFSALYRFGARKNPMTHLIRKIIWRKKLWCTDEFNAWIDQFNPQCVFLSFSNDYFIPEIAMYVANRFNIPILSSIGDDYYFNSERTLSLSCLVYKSTYKKLLRKVFAHRGSAIFISDKIRDKYNSAFNLNGETVYLTSNTKRRDFRPIHETNPEIAYFGNIRCGRYRSLNEIGSALGAIDHNYILQVYSDETDPKYCGAFDGNPNVRFCGSIPYKDVLEKIHESDIVLVVEGFTEHDIEITRYSLSTKVADLLASGVAILTYGSIECGAIEYMNAIDCSAVCCHKDELQNCITHLMRDQEYQRHLYDNAARISEQNHSIAHSAQTFERIVDRLVCS